jgi:hypothetical protein
VDASPGVHLLFQQFPIYILNKSLVALVLTIGIPLLRVHGKVEHHERDGRGCMSARFGPTMLL